MLFKPNPRTATKQQMKQFEQRLSKYSDTAVSNRYAVLSDDSDDDDSESEEWVGAHLNVFDSQR